MKSVQLIRIPNSLEKETLAQTSLVTTSTFTTVMAILPREKRNVSIRPYGITVSAASAALHSSAYL